MGAHHRIKDLEIDEGDKLEGDVRKRAQRVRCVTKGTWKRATNVKGMILGKILWGGRQSPQDTT